MLGTSVSPDTLVGKIAASLQSARGQEESSHQYTRMWPEETWCLWYVQFCTQSPMSHHLRAQIHSERDAQEDEPDANGNEKSNNPITVNT